MFSDHIRMKLESSNRKKSGKLTNMLKLNKTILKKSTGQKRYSKENEKKSLIKMKMKTRIPKPMSHTTA